MSGQVLDSCTTGLRSFSAMSRRSAALSRSALDSTFAFSPCTTDSIGATRLSAQAPRKPTVLGPCKGRDCAAVPNCHFPPFGLGFPSEIGQFRSIEFAQPQGRKRTMRTRDYLLSTTFAVTFLLLPAALPASAQSALTGLVTSTEEGAMEGVVVSAKRGGSTITISVVTDAQGRFSFPAGRLEPGSYTLKARAAGYELPGNNSANVAAGQEAKSDLKLQKVKNLSSHLTNAEWLTSMPGTEEQKKFLLNCTGCHTLERIVKSSYDADGFQQIFTRMSGYYPGSTPMRPQPLTDFVRDRGRDGNLKPISEWLSSINLSQQETWNYQLKTLPRLTGKSTRVIITEYDLPQSYIQPHDVMLDREGNAWYSDFGQMFLGKMDVKTGKVTQYPIPVVKPGWPVGTLNLE